MRQVMYTYVYRYEKLCCVEQIWKNLKIQTAWWIMNETNEWMTEIEKFTSSHTSSYNFNYTIYL